jgi:hypothetical protein
VIDDHTVANPKTTAPRTDLYNLATGLVTGDDSLVSLRTFAEMLVIDTANIRTADSGRLYSKQHFAVRRLRKRHAAEFNFIVTR